MVERTRRQSIVGQDLPSSPAAVAEQFPAIGLCLAFLRHDEQANVNMTATMIDSL